ncbi:MAG: Crp/Fnr family transcriptional regulator [Planctomycetota bacterium]|nr:MAG: Crp/Fnr family transcriptional regulator [Planctomycetota bacterium]
MSNSAVLATLSALPHFRMLERGLLDRICAGSRLRSFQSGASVFLEGEPCHGFFAVKTGGVRLYRMTPDGREQVVHNLRPGQTFAEAALLNLGRYPASAVATASPTELVEVGAEPFLRAFREDARLAPAMLGSLSMHLLSLVERVEELSLVDAGARLAHYLLRQPGRGPDGRVRIELPMPKKELAAHLAMTPETLSRLLRRWQDQGWIESGRGGVTILDGASLQIVADGQDRG